MPGLIPANRRAAPHSRATGSSTVPDPAPRRAPTAAGPTRPVPVAGCPARRLLARFAGQPRHAPGQHGERTVVRLLSRGLPLRRLAPPEPLVAAALFFPAALLFTPLEVFLVAPDVTELDPVAIAESFLPEPHLEAPGAGGVRADLFQPPQDRARWLSMVQLAQLVIPAGDRGVVDDRPLLVIAGQVVHRLVVELAVGSDVADQPLGRPGGQVLDVGFAPAGRAGPGCRRQ